MTEKVILGLDPGTNIMGYGIILVQLSKVKVLQFGVIQLGKTGAHELKLKNIFDRVLTLVDEFHPDEVALEAPLVKMCTYVEACGAQGVAMSAALFREAPITQYAPKKVKQSVTGMAMPAKNKLLKC